MKFLSVVLCLEVLLCASVLGQISSGETVWQMTLPVAPVGSAQDAKRSPEQMFAGGMTGKAVVSASDFLSHHCLFDTSQYSGSLFNLKSPLNDFDSADESGFENVKTESWTPFLQTELGAYNVVPEPGTFSLLAIAMIAWGAIFIPRRFAAWRPWRNGLQNDQVFFKRYAVYSLNVLCGIFANLNACRGAKLSVIPSRPRISRRNLVGL